jgi:hypothetical protein
MMRILKPFIVLLSLIITAFLLADLKGKQATRKESVMDRLFSRIEEVRKSNSYYKGSYLFSSEKSTISALRPNGPGPGASIRSSRTYQPGGRRAMRPDGQGVRPGRNYNRPFDQAARRNEMDLMRSENTQWIKNSTRQYSPESWHLLMLYDTLPEVSEAPTIDGGRAATQKAAGTFYYLRGHTRTDMLASMETNVHEIAHGYFDQNAFQYVREKNLKMDRNNAEGYIYINSSTGYFVSFPLKSMFPAKELAAVIPETMRTYRFETYIDGTTSTQSDGIIGLLNELDAYFIGSRYCYDMLDAYKAAAGSEASGFFEWVTHTQSTMSAFYEFDYFIREYLLFMKKNYPADYKKLVSDSSFKEAFASVRSSYKMLLDNYIARIRSESKKLNSSGEAEVGFEKGWLWIKSGNSNISSGTPMFSDLREKLIPVLASRRYREIAKDFQIK